MHIKKLICIKKMFVPGGGMEDQACEVNVGLETEAEQGAMA